MLEGPRQLLDRGLDGPELGWAGGGVHELPAQAAERAAVRLQHLQGRWIRLGAGGQGSTGLEEGALGPAQAQGRGLALLGE